MIDLNQYKSSVENLVSKLTLDEKVNLMCQYQDEIPRLGIKKYKHGTEASHGVSWLGKATMFPQPIGLACLWDKNLMGEIGKVIGVEARGFFAKDPAINGLTLWAPTIDLNRDPRWGRSDEGYGEDPVLVGNLAASIIKGIQGDDPNFYRAAPTLKHFYGNNNEIDRGFSSTNISERIKREYYLKVFKIAIENSGVLSMMTAYNSINGIPANIHPDLQNIVRDEWGWPGFVVSDAGDVLSLISEHKYCQTPEEAVALSIKAGIDSITDDHEVSKKAIVSALKKGSLLESDLDLAISRGLLVRHVLGEFSEDNPYKNIKEDVIGAKEHSKIAKIAATKSIVLLKNDGVLPIRNPETKIGIIGNLADRIYRDWYSGEFLYQVPANIGLKVYYNNITVSDSNDRVTIEDNISGLYLNSNGEFTKDATIFEMEDWGWGAVTFKSTETNKYLTCNDDYISATSESIWGWFTKEVFYTKIGESVQIKTWNTAGAFPDNNKLNFQKSDSSDGAIGITASTPLGPVECGSGNFNIKVVSNGFEQGINCARNVEIPIVIIGNHPLINGKETIDRHDIVLTKRQKDLALAVVKENPKAVLVVVGSYPFALEELNEEYSSIIYTSHLGQETGNALKDIISGHKNPGGKLPITWYKSANDLGDIMSYELPECKKTYLYFQGDVEYPFGHGLSYSSFSYSNFSLEKENITSNDIINMSVNIKNTGLYDGDEVIQLYIKHYGEKVVRPINQLAYFDRVHLMIGEERTFNIKISASEFNYWDNDEGKFVWEKGIGEIILGSSSRSIIISQKVNLV